MSPQTWYNARQRGGIAASNTRTADRDREPSLGAGAPQVCLGTQGGRWGGSLGRGGAPLALRPWTARRDRRGGGAMAAEARGGGAGAGPERVTVALDW